MYRARPIDDWRGTLLRSALILLVGVAIAPDIACVVKDEAIEDEAVEDDAGEEDAVEEDAVEEKKYVCLNPVTHPATPRIRIGVLSPISGSSRARPRQPCIFSTRPGT